MRIEALQFTPIALGDPPLLNASGLHAPFALRIVLELVTDAGIAGLSEIPGDGAALNALHRISARLPGISVHDLRTIDRVVQGALDGETIAERGEQSWDRRLAIHLLSGLEVACLDATARRLDCRVADLLGVVRERVPFAGYLFFKYAGAGGPLGFGIDHRAEGWDAARQAEALDAPGLVAQAGAMVREFGFASLKVKGGVFDPDLEAGAVLALRDTFGEGIPLRIDPNAVWRFETALRVGKRLRGVVEYLEDPVRGQAGMARLRRELDVPLATNMCTTSVDELATSVRLGSEDIILADHHFWGGLRATTTLAHTCRLIGRSLSMHSNSHAGISFAAMIHGGAALPDLPFALDTHYPWQAEDVILGGRLRIRDGCASLPDGPGLGVELDRDALAVAHARYVACGLERRDDELAMQAKQPGWRFQPTRF